jgi:hypothetical protein
MTEQGEENGQSMRITEKIQEARNLYSRFGGRLREDGGFRAEVTLFLEIIARSGKASIDLGVVDACRACEEERGGSCCGRGIEDRYNPVMLLLNLLFDVDLPEIYSKSGSCLFLGERGCLLKVRHILCINYLCLELQKKLGEDGLELLQQATGDEMEAVFMLHENVKRRLARLGEAAEGDKEDARG